MVSCPSPAVRFVYLPKMNAFLNSYEADDGDAVIEFFPNDSAIGTAVVKKSMHTNIPTILFFMVFFPLLQTNQLLVILCIHI